MGFQLKIIGAYVPPVSHLPALADAFPPLSCQFGGVCSVS
jgi:hypothetical protein